MNWSLFLQAFGLLFLAELGDKTQLAVIGLAAKHRAPVPVFLGAVSALALVTLLGAMGGEALARLVPASYLRKGAAIAFMAMGVLMFLDRI